MVPDRKDAHLRVFVASRVDARAGGGGLTAGESVAAGLDQGEQLVLQSQEVAADLCRVQFLVLTGEFGLEGTRLSAATRLYGVFALAYRTHTFP